ncbi:CHAT domain-containing protein [Coleofasciculus sp.]|uniref:CHAT domain-containing protein n=1 Tax=Coleofasciculus sp. TaxID=3100458 RepID=UPI0039F8BF68
MNDITVIIKGLLQQKTAPSLHQYIINNPELLSNQVDAYLVSILDNLQEKDRGLVSFFANHIRTLRLCRLIGVDQALKQEIIEKFILIGYFLDKKTWEESQEFLESHPELIQEQVEMLLGYLAQVQLDQKSRELVQEHRELLKRCREVGIDEAFQEKIKILDQEYNRSLHPIEVTLSEVKVDVETAITRDNNVSWLDKISANVTNNNKNLLSSEEYFFIKGLQISWNYYNEHPQVVIKFLEKNIGSLNNNLIQFLRNFNENILSSLKIEELANFAKTALDFFGLIEHYFYNKKQIDKYNNKEEDNNKKEEEINKEIAIAGYEIVTSLIIREAALEEWVRSQVYLATAYRDRIRGDKFENLEKTILACQNGLQVCNNGAFPKRRNKLQYELKKALSKKNYGKEKSPEQIISAYSGIWFAYSHREKYPNLLEETIEFHFQETPYLSVKNISKFDFFVGALLELSSAYSTSVIGNHSENLERSISCSKDILNIVNCKTNPIDWAKAQNTLGFAYTERIQGEHAENVEKAIRYHFAALDKCTREVCPEEWARGQSDLGVAYRERILGERAENLEAAIQCYSSALEVYSREVYPFEWAKTQYNLGVAYNFRIRGNKAENLRSAIQCFSSATEVYNLENYPQKWATTMQALGGSYISLSSVSESAEMIEAAIQCFSSALEVYNREFSPFEWARIQFNLGNAYTVLSVQKDKAENLETAIEFFLRSLEVRLRKTDPNRWAMTQSQLGQLYSIRVNGERTRNLQVAIQYFSNALKVHTYEAYPLNYAKNQYLIGTTYQKADQVEKAYTAFKNAINSIESIREEIVTGTGMEVDKQKLAEEWNDLYQSMIKVCLELEKPVEAIEYVERSKTRNLVELILSNEFDVIFFPDVVSKLKELRDKIASGQYELQNARAEDPTTLAQHLQQLRQQRNELQDRYLPIGSGFQFEPFRSTLSHRTAIVEFYMASDKLLVFIVTKQTKQPIVLSPNLINLKKIENLVNSYLKAYRKNHSHWQRRLTTRLHVLAKILHIDEIIQQIPKECNQLILVPHRSLHLLPLQALSLAGESHLFDRFPGGVSYAPSCQLLQLAKTRQRPNFTHLFAIQNPTNDLAYTDLEVQAITGYFNPVNIFKHKTATLTAINQANLNAIHCAHFSCHGYFNLENARKSALILADAPLTTVPTNADTKRYLNVREGETHDLDKCLTLDAILSLNLEQCRLVTLSACETGLIDFKNTSDEYIGLPSGFLIAGSACVVSSLWRVDDIASAFLMIKFYQNLKSGSTVALALNQAQTWLRDATKEQLEQWASQLPLDDEQELQLDTLFYNLQPSSKPFESPYHWAAFCAIGQ